MTPPLLELSASVNHTSSVSSIAYSEPQSVPYHSQTPTLIPLIPSDSDYAMFDKEKMCINS